MGGDLLLGFERAHDAVLPVDTVDNMVVFSDRQPLFVKLVDDPLFCEIQDPVDIPQIGGSLAPPMKSDR